MRLNLLFAFSITLFFSSIAMESNAQRVTLVGKELAFADVLTAINRQTGYNIAMKRSLARPFGKITLNLTDSPLPEALRQLFAEKNIDFEINDANRTVIVKARNQVRSFNPPVPRGESDGSTLVLALPEVRGRVVDSVGNPLVGASVRVLNAQGKRTTLQTTTDNDGYFLLRNVPEEAQLEITYVGHLAQSVVASADIGVVVLRTIPSELAEVEVVSTGYQTIPKERATGSFVFVDSALFNRAVSTDIISRLKGVVPSLLFDERAGGEPKLSIRGRSTIYANADPLIVVDNFPYEGDLRNINPNDIENVSILRDAAAASIWGVRAGNGVIVITTKKGRFNQPIQVGFNSNLTISAKPDLFYEQQITPSDFIDIEQELFEQGYYTNNLANTTTFPVISPAVEIMADAGLPEVQKQRQLDLLRGTDIRNDIGKHFYRNAVNQQYALNLRGGGDRHRYYYAANLDHNRQSVRSDSYRRINITARNQFSFFDRLHVQTALEVSNSQTTTDNTLYWLQTAFPYQRLVDDDGNALPMARDFRASFAAGAEEEGRLDWQYFPLQEPDNRDNRTELTHYRANVSGRYALWKGLELSVYYQYEQQATERNDLFHPESYLVRDLVNRFTQITPEGDAQHPVPLGSILDRTAGNLRSHNGRAQLGYQRNWRDLHEVTALAGFEVRESDYRSHSNRYYGYDENTGTAIPVDLADLYPRYPAGGWAKITTAQSINGTLNRFRSFYANGAYTYGKRYTFSASARMDQTNLFGVRANQRSIPLWSAGMKWDVNREAFYALDWLPRLSLRYSFGYNGNFDETATAFITARYGNTSYGTRQAILGALPNPALRAERTATANFGLDFSITDYRVVGTFDYYRKSGKDLIGNAPIDPTTGRTSFRGNLAHMKGGGMDLSIQARNIMRSHFSWSTNLLWSYNFDKVIDYQVPPTRTYFFEDPSLSGYVNQINPVNDRPLYGVYSYPWAGLDPLSGDPLGYLDGELSSDYAAILAQNEIEKLQFHGRALPAHFGAFRNTFRIRQFEFSINLTYKVGYYFRRSSTVIHYDPTVILQHADYAKRWQKPGDERYTTVPSFTYPAQTSRNSFYRNSAVLVEKGDHIRIQDIQAAYYLGKHTQLFVYASNIAIVWRANKHGIDPDYNGNTALGATALPAPLSLSLGFRTSIQ